MQFAVLTGDIVSSSDLTASQLDAALDAINTAVSAIASWRKGLVTGHARRGGDSWQCAIGAPVLDLRAALFIRAALRREGKALSTRIAIARGPGTLPEDADPNGAHGPAFTASGRLLADISNHAQMAHASGGLLAATTRLADHISQDWTVAQARAMHAALPPGTGPRAEIAEQLGITRQAVNQALWAAGFPAISDALELTERDEDAA
ncbi:MULTISPECIES: MarR family transcriptional regulator [unclassified Roseovarius]|uniref:MarR family transcriptional regulator n=1 Tax=unclassified Roseovarius TaxID=2614913 RepID=UPI00273E0D37|nr:MarR family transcriptional regulator [Roseovarius sp. MMSF_3350]